MEVAIHRPQQRSRAACGQIRWAQWARQDGAGAAPRGQAALTFRAASAALAAAWDLPARPTFPIEPIATHSPDPRHLRFSQIKICVHNNPVRLCDVDVKFHNGGHQDVFLRSRINAGDCSRSIDLDGLARHQEDQFTYGAAAAASLASFACTPSDSCARRRLHSRSSCA